MANKYEYNIPEGYEASIEGNKVILEKKESEDEKIRKEIIFLLKHYSSEEELTTKYPIESMIAYLEKQKEQSMTANDLDEEVHRFFDDCIVVHEAKLYGNISERVIPVDCYELTARHFAKWGEKQKAQKPVMIQWTGKNLKEVIDFTGKSPQFSKWFKSWKDFENYVHSHDDILKLFCEDGSHYEVPVGAWIVKTPDGYNVASQATFVEKQKNVYKPSNTQMYVLNWVANILLNREGIVEGEAAKILQTLYDELKKL